MVLTAEVLAALVALVNVAAGALGAWRWWQVEQDPRVWPLVRAGQGVAAVQAAGAGVLFVAGFDPDGLYWLYALLPIGVSFVAEQLRVASAEVVLETRGLPDAQAVGTLPEREQRSVVTQILRRELGVMSAAALVIAFLALRVFGTA